MARGRKRRIRGTMVAPVVHSRLSSDLLRNADVAPVEIDDPWPQEPGAKILAFRSLRDDPLARMHIRKQIDDAQYHGGRAWQRDYEIAEIGGARAIDTTKEAVDGGQLPEMLTERQQKAFHSLNRLARVLGQIGSALVHDVLAEGKGLEVVAAERGHDNQRSVDFYGRLFRECLELLAVEYRYATRPQVCTTYSDQLQGVGQNGSRNTR